MNEEIKTKEQHKQRHIELHQYLDELVADFVTQTGELLSNKTIYDLIKWSYGETLNPSDRQGLYDD